MSSKPKRKVSGEAVLEIMANHPGLIINAMTTRQDLMDKILDPRRDINIECGYPNNITDEQYRVMYDREIGRRVVSVYPEETWKRMPRIYEDPDPENNTAFEESLDELDSRIQLLHYLQRADELSGVGQYGVILWGLSDGAALNEPVEGHEVWEEETGNPTTPPAKGHTVIYVRVLDASLVRVSQYETDATKPRYGKPVMYTLTLSDSRNQEAGATVSMPSLIETSVHWTRISHIADNRKTSETLGTPRMEPVWNRLYDLRKVLGGSGEMFWRGGFPGVSLETQPGLDDAELDEDATRTMMYNYMNGLQRYIALNGMTAKSLSPQISDPSASFDVQIKAICVTIGVPFRVFMGIEEGVVSGDQVTKAWTDRLVNRQHRYVTPMVIDPVLMRLVAYGALAPPAEPRGWVVEWPDLSTPNEKDKAEVAVKKTEALVKYVAGGVDALVPPMEYLTLICGVEPGMATAILEAAVEHIEGIDDEEITPPRLPAPGDIDDEEEEEV